MSKYEVTIDGKKAGFFSYVSGLKEALQILNSESSRLRRTPSLRAQILSDPDQTISNWALGHGNPYVELTLRDSYGKAYLVSNAWVNHYGILEKEIEIQLHGITELY